MRPTPQRLAKIIAVVLLAGLAASCGSTNPATQYVPSESSSGTLITLMQDLPVCNAISANLVIQGLNFTLQQGQEEVNYLAATPAVAPLISLNMSMYRDFTTVLFEGPVRSGTYSQADFDFDYGELAVFDPTQNPPTFFYTITLTNTKPVVTLNPPLVITANQANVILLDFDMLRTIMTDSAGNITGQFNPTVNVTQLSAVNSNGAVNPNGYTEIDDLWGFVRSVTTINDTSNPSYIGNFHMQLLSPSTENAPNVPVNLTAMTNNVGFADLGHLLPNSYVEADVILDSQGNLAAKTVEVQAVENPFPTQTGVTPSTALIGPITQITTTAGGVPTGFNMWVRDAEPDDTSKITTDRIFQVDLTVNPTFQASVLGPNFANLTFGPQNLSVGQEVVVHGAYTAPTSPTGTPENNQAYFVEPTQIFLKLQSIQGTMTSKLSVGTDNATGAFIINPCCAILNGSPIYVVTNNQTTYVNATGLGAITNVNNLLVKGMPYYEPQSVTINGVVIPAGTLVIQAKQVHVLT